MTKEEILNILDNGTIEEIEKLKTIATQNEEVLDMIKDIHIQSKKERNLPLSKSELERNIATLSNIMSKFDDKISKEYLDLERHLNDSQSKLDLIIKERKDYKRRMSGF